MHIQCLHSFLERYWEMVDRLQLTHLYTIPTVIKFLMKAGNGHVDKYKLSSLKVLALGNNCLCTTLILQSVIFCEGVPLRMNILSIE